MKNKEKYAKEIVKIAIEAGILAIEERNGEPVSCEGFICEDCLFFGTNCQLALEAWANAEFENKEPKRFAKREKLFIEALPNVAYVARNKDGTLYAYKDKPRKMEDEFSRENIIFPILEDCFKLPFEDVKWSDPGPTSRKDILGDLEMTVTFGIKEDKEDEVAKGPGI